MISKLSNNLYCMQCYSIFSFECNLISQKKKHKFFPSCFNEVLTIYKFVCGSVFLQAFKPTHGWHSALSPAAVFLLLVHNGIKQGLSQQRRATAMKKRDGCCSQDPTCPHTSLREEDCRGFLVCHNHLPASWVLPSCPVGMQRASVHTVFTQNSQTAALALECSSSSLLLLFHICIKACCSRGGRLQ
jgi:hypothetical protein